MGELRRVEIIGDVVRRPRMPWTSTVHDLLRFLIAEELPVPEPVALDGWSERVRIVPGDAGQDAWPHQVDVDGVRSAGRLLRRIHDATAAWTPPPDAVWSVPFEPGEVICHGDPQPANFAWANGEAVGLFDWDAARPAPRLSDIAYALEWFAPFERDPAELARRGFDTVLDRKARIRAFLEGYGWDEPIDVVDAVIARQQQAIDEVIHLGAAGHEPHATWVGEGWPERWLKLDTTRSLASEV